MLKPLLSFLVMFHHWHLPLAVDFSTACDQWQVSKCLGYECAPWVDLSPLPEMMLSNAFFQAYSYHRLCKTTIISLYILLSAIYMQLILLWCFHSSFSQFSICKSLKQVQMWNKEDDWNACKSYLLSKEWITKYWNWKRIQVDSETKDNHKMLWQWHGTVQEGSSG